MDTGALAVPSSQAAKKWETSKETPQKSHPRREGKETRGGFDCTRFRRQRRQPGTSMDLYFSAPETKIFTPGFCLVLSQGSRLAKAALRYTCGTK